MILNHKNWIKICKEVKTFNHIRADQISKKLTQPWVVIKHDIETNPEAALKIAKIEHSFGIHSTFYVQGDLILNNEKIFKEIQSLGHEITYHYDVLDANNGNFNKASLDFQKNIENFESLGFKIKTICPHGNPLMKRDGWSSNRDFFENEEVRENFKNIFDIVVDLDDVSKDCIYISDAGYSFNQILNISGKNKENMHASKPIDINNIANLCKFNPVVISTHPHRWPKYASTFLYRKYFFMLLKQVARYLYKIPIFRNVITRFFFLARKI